MFEILLTSDQLKAKHYYITSEFKGRSVKVLKKLLWN